MTGLETLSPWVIVYVAIVIAVAGWIQGALGLGFPMIATPLIAAATNMQFAVVMVLIPCIAAVIVSIFRSPGFGDVLKRFWWMPFVALTGAAIGARLFVLYPGFPYALLLAGAILFYLNLERLDLSQWPLMKRHDKSFGVVFGLLGGISETTANIAAPPLIIYYLGIGLPPLMLVPAMNISFFVGKSTQFVTLAASGIASPMHWLVTLPLAYLLMRYAVPDATVGGLANGLVMVCVMLAFLASLGILLSTAFRNVQLAILAVMVSVLFSGALLQFLGLTWMSTTAVLNQLPQTFRGTTTVWATLRVVIVFGALTAASITAAVWVFRRKDL